jgi:hypothetical protein
MVVLRIQKYLLILSPSDSPYSFANDSSLPNGPYTTGQTVIVKLTWNNDTNRNIYAFNNTSNRQSSLFILFHFIYTRIGSA